MIFSRLLFPSMLALLCAACNGPSAVVGAANHEETSSVMATTLDDQVVLPTADYLKLPQYKNVDVEYGRQLARQCLACHSFEKNSAGPAGPSLYGFFGRPVGSVDGYAYSAALTNASFIWTPRALDAWLAQPARFLPGNRMAYAGMANQDNRNALVAALLQLTNDGHQSL